LINANFVVSDGNADDSEDRGDPVVGKPEVQPAARAPDHFRSAGSSSPPCQVRGFQRPPGAKTTDGAAAAQQ